MRPCPSCNAANEENEDFCGTCGAYLRWAEQSETTANDARTGERGAASTAGAGTAVAPAAAPAPAPAPAGSTVPPAPAVTPAPAVPPAPVPPAPVAPTGEVPAATGTGQVPTGTAGATGTPEAPAPPVPATPPVPAAPPAPPARSTPPAPVAPPAPPVQAPPPVQPPPSAPPVRPAPSAPSIQPVRPVRPAQGDPPRPTSSSAPQMQDDFTPVLPAKPVAQRPVVRSAEVTEATDGRPCPACGTPNKPERRFCLRCAAPLTETRTAPVPTGWRTRWPFGRKGGVRAGSGDGFRRTVIVLVALAVLAAVVLLIPAGRALFEDTQDKLKKPVEISPSAVTASAEVPGHPAGLAMDGLSNRYWGAPRLGESVTFTFDRPFRLVAAVVFTGPSAKAQEFRNQARATQLELVTTSKDGEVRRKKLTLNDKPGQQTVQLGVSDVVKAQLVVRAAVGLESGKHIALGEVEFFKRS